jgi:hypothetical protein
MTTHKKGVPHPPSARRPRRRKHTKSKTRPYPPGDRRGGNPPLTPADIRDIEHRWVQGKPMNAIRQETGHSLSTISKYVNMMLVRLETA